MRSRMKTQGSRAEPFEDACGGAGGTDSQKDTRASHLDFGLRQREKLAARMTEVLDWALLCHSRPTKIC